MRLICPNCGAQYNVSDDAIPPGGRDVQCSSCSHTWFQTEKPIAQNATEELERPPLEKPARRPIDTSISDILREEAAREQQLRDATRSGPPKTQEDTRPKVVDADETRKRIAQMTEAEGGTRIAGSRADETRSNAPAVAGTANPEHDPNPRNIPSINEINSELRARSQAPDESLTPAEQQEAVSRRGFRRGFVFVLLVFAILFAPYVFAEQITATFPQTQDGMTAYVAAIDQLRLSLNQAVNAVGDAITGMTDGGGNGTPD